MRLVLCLGIGCSPVSPLDLEGTDEEVRVRPGSVARLTPDGPALWADETTGPLTLSVFEADSLRVATERAGVELAVYIDAEDVLDAYVETGWHGPIWARSGEPVEVLESTDTEVRVHLVHERFEIDAWVDAEPIGPIYLEDLDTPIASTEGRTVTIRGSAPIYRAPSGDVIGWTRPFSEASPRIRWVTATSTGAVDGDLLEVVIPGRRVAVRGWIEQEDIEGMDLGGRGFSIHTCGLWGYAASLDEPTVWSETLLYDQPGGEVVGRATRDLWNPVLSESEGWLGVEADSPWGPVELWIHPDDA